MNRTVTARTGRVSAFSLCLVALSACLLAIGLVLMSDPDTLMSFGRCLDEHEHLMDWLVVPLLVVLYVDTCIGGIWHWWRLVLPFSVVIFMIVGNAIGFVELWQLAIVFAIAATNLAAKQWHYKLRH